MRYGVLFLISLFFCANVLAANDFTGKFTCKGHDPYLNKDYTGTIEVTPHNTVYDLKMKYDTGEDAKGTGAQYNTQLLFVVFQDTKDLKKVGLEQYEWKENGSKLAGFWVYLGSDKLGREICEKVVA